MGRLFVVVGLGRFGTGVARTLAEEGQQVLALDRDRARVQELADVLPRVVQCDATDPEALRAVGVRNGDTTAVVAIGDSMEASILATLNLKELGVRRVIAKAASDQHAKALERCGADRVVYPQRDMGVRVAHNLVAKSVLDYVQLSPHHSMVEMAVGPTLAGQTLWQLQLPQRFGAIVVAIRRGRRVVVSPRADELLQAGDVLVLIGPNEGIQRLEELA